MSYFVKYVSENPITTNSQRIKTLEYVDMLAKLTINESKFLSSQCHHYVRAVLSSGGFTKNVGLMRELQAVAAAPDDTAAPAAISAAGSKTRFSTSVDSIDD